MSLEEEELPPSTQGGGGTPHRAWVGVDSSQGGYDTLESTDNEVSMHEMSGGDGYWAREEMNSTSMEQENEKLKEQVIAMKTEVMKYKHQLDCQSSDEVARLKAELEITQQKTEELVQEVEGSDNEVARLKAEFEIAQQKTEESDQEVILLKLLLESSPNPSMSTAAQNGGEPLRVMNNLQGTCEKLQQKNGGGELDMIKEELEKTSGECNEVRVELDKVRGELHKTRSERDEVRGELDKTRGELSEVRGEQRELQGTFAEVKGELQGTIVELEQVKSKLHSREIELENAQNYNAKATFSGESHEAKDHLHTKKELEKAKRELGATQMELVEVKKRLEAKEREREEIGTTKSEPEKTTPRRKLIDLTVRKLEESKKELSRKEKECEELQASIQKMKGEKSLLENDSKTKGEKLSEIDNLLRLTQADLEKVNSDCYSETQKRLDLDRQLTLDKRDYQLRLTEQSVTIDRLQQDSQKKEEEFNLSVQAEICARAGTETELRSVLKEKEQVEKEMEHMVQEKDEVVRKNTAMLSKMNRIEEDKNELHTKVLETEEVCGGFKEEAEKTMEDYHKIAAQLQKETEDKEKMRLKSDKYLNELSRRTEEVRSKDKELKKKKVPTATLR